MAMFTGLVESVGQLERRVYWGTGARLAFRSSVVSLGLGESIAIDGVCLTVDRISPTGFEVDASSETLAKTTLGELAVGADVNLERAVRLGERMGGHIVTGHVDGIV